MSDNGRLTDAEIVACFYSTETAPSLNYLRAISDAAHAKAVAWERERIARQVAEEFAETNGATVATAIREGAKK